jgi:endonuclease-3
VERVISALRKHYGSPGRRAGGDPLDHLIGTILSQNTSDANTDRAYRALRERFPTWEQVRDATDAEVAQAIRSGGLAEQKAPRIRRILQILTAERGRPDLGFLSDMATEEAREWLQTLPGVGPKTASCVLLFALGRDVFPVDTHVERIAKRLGLVPANTAPEGVQHALEALTPEGGCLEGHLLLIGHGRALCRARSPLCQQCPVSAMCAFHARSESPAALGAEAEVGHTEPDSP